MKEKGYEFMPSNVINEDHWIALITKDVVGNKVVSRHIGYNPKSKFYYRNPNMAEIYLTTKRIFIGQLQLIKEYPDLGPKYERKLSLISRDGFKVEKKVCSMERT